MTNFHWSDAAVISLKEKRESGLSFARIADLLGCTPGSAVGKAHRLGLPSPAPEVKLKSTSLTRNVAPNKVINTRLKLEDEAMKCTRPAPKGENAANTPLPTSRMISIMELCATTCRLPLGNPRQAGFAYCGAECGIGLVYCPTHRAMSRSSDTPSERLAAHVSRRQVA